MQFNGMQSVDHRFCVAAATVNRVAFEHGIESASRPESFTALTPLIRTIAAWKFGFGSYCSWQVSK